MNTSILASDFWAIWTVVPQTLALSVLILVLGVLIGTILWQLHDSRFLLVRGIYRVYTSYFRGMPLLIHLLLTYYALPVAVKVFSDQFHWGIDTQHISSMYAIIVSYTLYSASFLAEIVRGSFKSVGTDQLEAAQALGYSHTQQFTAVWLPQALTEAVPKILNYYTLLIRQLSLAFLVSFVDIFAKSKLQSSVNAHYIESFVAAAIVYWVLCVILTFIFSKYETYLRRYERGTAL